MRSFALIVVYFGTAQSGVGIKSLQLDNFLVSDCYLYLAVIVWVDVSLLRGCSYCRHWPLTKYYISDGLHR